eukprot:7920272-Alexandrium_andersonii.AAC.1
MAAPNVAAFAQPLRGAAGVLDLDADSSGEDGALALAAAPPPTGGLAPSHGPPNLSGGRPRFAGASAGAPATAAAGAGGAHAPHGSGMRRRPGK